MFNVVDRNGTPLNVGDIIKVVGSQITGEITNIRSVGDTDYLSIEGFSRELSASIVILYRRGKSNVA